MHGRETLLQGLQKVRHPLDKLMSLTDGKKNAMSDVTFYSVARPLSPQINGFTSAT